MPQQLWVQLLSVEEALEHSLPFSNLSLPVYYPSLYRYLLEAPDAVFNGASLLPLNQSREDQSLHKGSLKQLISLL